MGIEAGASSGWPRATPAIEHRAATAGPTLYQQLRLTTAGVRWLILAHLTSVQAAGKLDGDAAQHLTQAINVGR